MIKVKLKSRRKSNTIKTSFKEVTVEDLLKIRKHTPREVLAALSDIAAEDLAALSSEEVLALYELVSFIDDLNEAAAAVPLNADLPEVDVASETLEKLELARKRCGELKEPYRLFIELVRIYYGAERLTGEAAPALALGALIFKDLTAFFERFKDLEGEKPTEEQEEAGIAALHSFGPYGIVEGIAAKYHVRPFDVFKWTAEEVYLELTYQLAKGRYQDNLREIENRKSAPAKK